MSGILKYNKSLFFVLLLLLLIIINSCKKDATATSPDNTTPALDCVNAENFFVDAKNIVDEAGFKNGAFNGILNDTSITVQYDTLNHANPDTILINFGANDILCTDGRARKGKITTIFNGHYADTAKTHTITFTNYYVDNNALTGTILDSYKGLNSSGHQHFTDTITGKMIYVSNKIVTFIATNKFQFITGDSTTIWSNHKMTITGNTSGYASDGTGYSTYVSTPLLRNFANGCRKYLSQGVIQVAETNLPYSAANLGNGNCNGIIIVGVNGNNYTLNAN